MLKLGPKNEDFEDLTTNPSRSQATPTTTGHTPPKDCKGGVGIDLNTFVAHRNSGEHT